MAVDAILQAMRLESAHIDIHCHRRAGRDNLDIVSIDALDFTPGALIDGFYTLGIHPWFIGRQNCRTALDKIAAAGDDPNLLAIGECGLDKAVVIPLTLQIEVFHSQIILAERLGKPLIVHCVRAFNELMQSKKNAKAGTPWIIHGFNGNRVLAGQLLKQGFYLSFGKALLREHGNAGQVLGVMPADRLFLETDAADVPISEIYAAAAKIAGMDVKALQQQIITNFRRVFLHD